MQRRTFAISALSLVCKSASAGLLDLFNGVSVGKKVAIPQLSYFGKKPDPKKSFTLWYFWATWCGPCRETFPLLNDWVKRYPELAIVAVTDEGEDLVRAFAAKVAMDMPIALDLERKLFGPLRIRSLPYAMLLNADATVVWRGQPKELNAEELLKLLKPAAAGQS